MAIEDVQDYLAGPFQSVEGWCGPHLWQAIEPLHDLQVSLGVEAPVAEIGVYHGKFLIGLIKTKAAERGNYAVDVFDMQQFNLDGAGKGNLEVLLRNLARSGVSREAVEVARTDSMAIDDRTIAAMLDASGGGFSLFSVDGCHLAGHTINDVTVATRLTRPEGIIFVDDYYNAKWPGVHEGVAKLYLMSSPRFVPLLYTSNKLFLCHISFHKQYLDAVEAHVRSLFPTTAVKNVARYGYPTLTVTPNTGTEAYTSLSAPKPEEWHPSLPDGIIGRKA